MIFVSTTARLDEHDSGGKLEGIVLVDFGPSRGV